MDACCIHGEGQTSTELQRLTPMEVTGDMLRRCRLMCHGHEKRMGDTDWVNELFQIGGEEDGSCQQHAGEDLSECCVYRHVFAES